MVMIVKDSCAGFGYANGDTHHVMDRGGYLVTCNSEREARVEATSAVFSRLVRDELAEDFDRVVERNRALRMAGEDDVCATHDFCDANVLMAEAFKEVYGRDVNIDDRGDLEIWGAAWTLSVDREFMELLPA